MKDKLAVVEADEPWYAEGLRFKCTECGQCCTGFPGYTWVSTEEIATIAKHLNLSIEEFSKKYLRKVDGRFSLLERPQTFDCIFLRENKCQIYSVRPTQCRTFPWWAQNLRSQKDWEKAAKFCEGMNQGPLVPYSKIEEQRKLNEK